jgi:hypothetical protein
MICNYPPQSLCNETPGKRLQINNKPVPGDLVSHVRDEECLGVVVAVDGDVVTVMWSKKPWFIGPWFNIKAQTKWSVENEDDVNSIHRVR